MTGAQTLAPAPTIAFLVLSVPFRPTDFGHRQIEMTFEDCRGYARPWTIKYEATYAADTE